MRRFIAELKFKIAVFFGVALLFLVTCLAYGQLPASFTVGVCTHNARHGYNSMPMLEKIGAKIVRDEMPWQNVERTKGKFSLDPRMVDYINALNARNIKPLIVLDYSNRLYAPNNKYGPNTPALREAFGRYVSFLVSTFKSKVYAWEIWNEPDSDLFWQPAANAKNYSLLVKYIAPLIHRIDPKAIVVAGALSTRYVPYLDSLRNEGALNDVDAVSFHWYFRDKSPANPTLKNNLAVVGQFVQSIKRLGKEAWVTEMGYSTNTGKYGVTEAQQAEYLKKHLELAKSMGIEVCIIYDLIDDGPDPRNREDRLGLFRQDGTPKPAAMVLPRN